MSPGEHQFISKDDLLSPIIPAGPKPCLPRQEAEAIREMEDRKD
jgi:hypothetical protein